MGSVGDYIKCPNCKMEASSDFYYKTGEEYINCPHCGYHYSAIIKNREKLLNELTEDDWDILEHKTPYGYFRYKMAGEEAYTVGTLVTEEDAARFRVAMILEYQDHVEQAYISRVIDGNKEVEWVVGSGVKEGDV